MLPVDLWPFSLWDRSEASLCRLGKCSIYYLLLIDYAFNSLAYFSRLSYLIESAIIFFIIGREKQTYL